MPTDSGGIAIAGMAALFPGAPDLDTFRTNLRAGRDAISDVPPDRWDPVFYDPESAALDRFYGRRGGFIDPWAVFDPLEHGIVPDQVDDAEPDQLIVLDLAVSAIRDAGLRPADLPRARTGVFLGRGGYISAGLARSAQRVREGEQLLAVLRQVLPDLPAADLDRVKAAFRTAAGDLPADAAIGLVPNLAASRTANRLDLHGPAFTFDAACASALIAVDHAMQELRAGRLDAALVGGVHLCHDPTFWSLFCRLGALSRRGELRAFDEGADGLLIGEGAGMLLLLREADARQPWAILRGSGTASDGRSASLMSPSPGGQRLALQRAWDDSGLDPSTVGLIEAHGTATVAGDAAELRTLADFFGPLPPGAAPGCLGSVKSMIGHTMPAAGIAGLIKAALAVHDGLHLPTLHCERPRPEVAATRFRTRAEAAPWPEADHPRRAGVNAFGFGGINAHVVLEQAVGPSHTRPEPIALYAADDLTQLAAAILADHRAVEPGPCRLALRDPSPARREQAADLARRGRPWHGRRGMWLSPAPEVGGVALLFPGVEEATDGDLHEVAAALDLPVPDVLRQPPAGLDDLGLRSAQILAAGRITHAALRALGLSPTVLAGHSVGEWTSLVAAGVIHEASLDGFIHSLADDTLAVPDVAYAALGCDAARAATLIAPFPEVVISHDNAPHQTLICGPEADVRAVLAASKTLGAELPFRSGFHTSHFQPFADRFTPHIHRLPLGRGQLPVWSSCTVAPWPDDEAGVRALLARQLVEPVRFRETLLALWEGGARVFVQAGAGSLTGLVADTLKDRPHAALATSEPRRGALDQLAWAAAALWTLGLPVRTARLPQLRGGRGRRLRLGAPLVRLADPPRLSAATTTVAPGPIGAASGRLLDAMRGAHSEVLAALQVGPAVAHRTWTRRVSVDTEPWLRDHAMFQQPEGQDDASRFPVVPMTGNLQRMMEAAQELHPRRPIIGLDKAVARRWLVAAPPVDLVVDARTDGPDRVHVVLEGYAEATVLFGDRYPIPPAADPTPLRAPGPTPVTVDRLYADRWMFHGPAFQGVVALGPIGEDGIHGAIVAPAAPGALLDNAGQIFGYWGFAKLPVDALGFPARVDRLRFYGPMPAPGTRLQVRCRVREVTREAFVGDIELTHEGRLWCRLEGWRNRRFETDEVLLPFVRLPAAHGLGEPLPDGGVRVRERWRTAASRELLIRRYLDEDGARVWAQLAPTAQRAWTLRRIALCEAARRYAWDHGHGPLFPVEVGIEEQPDGTALASGPFDLRLRARAGEGYVDAWAVPVDAPTRV